MGRLQTSEQKIKGKAQEALGFVERKMGYPVQGAKDKVKGKANVAISNIKKKVQDAI